MERFEPGDVIEIDVDGTTVTAEVLAVTSWFAVLHSVEWGTATTVPLTELRDARRFVPPDDAARLGHSALEDPPEMKQRLPDWVPLPET